MSCAFWLQVTTGDPGDAPTIVVFVVGGLAASEVAEVEGRLALIAKAAVQARDRRRAARRHAGTEAGGAVGGASGGGGESSGDESSGEEEGDGDGEAVPTVVLGGTVLSSPELLFSTLVCS